MRETRDTRDRDNFEDRRRREDRRYEERKYEERRFEERRPNDTPYHNGRQDYSARRETRSNIEHDYTPDREYSSARPGDGKYISSGRRYYGGNNETGGYNPYRAGGWIEDKAVYFRFMENDEKLRANEDTLEQLKREIENLRREKEEKERTQVQMQMQIQPQVQPQPQIQTQSQSKDEEKAAEVARLKRLRDDYANGIAIAQNNYMKQPIQPDAYDEEISKLKKEIDMLMNQNKNTDYEYKENGTKPSADSYRNRWKEVRQANLDFRKIQVENEALQRQLRRRELADFKKSIKMDLTGDDDDSAISSMNSQSVDYEDVDEPDLLLDKTKERNLAEKIKETQNILKEMRMRAKEEKEMEKILKTKPKAKKETKKDTPKATPGKKNATPKSEVSSKKKVKDDLGTWKSLKAPTENKRGRRGKKEEEEEEESEDNVNPGKVSQDLLAESDTEEEEEERKKERADKEENEEIKMERLREKWVAVMAVVLEVENFLQTKPEVDVIGRKEIWDSNFWKELAERVDETLPPKLTAKIHPKGMTEWLKYKYNKHC